MSVDGSPQAKSPLMQGDPDKDSVGDKGDPLGAAGGGGGGGGAGSVAIDMTPADVSGSSSASKRKPPNWRLRYQDFTSSRASQSSNRQQDNEPSFQHLVDKANDWLSRNSDTSVLTCETLLWTSTRPHHLDDPELMVISRGVSQGSTTYYKRGLRLWLTPRLSSNRNAQVLSYIDYAPETDDVISTVINRANKAVTSNGIAGKIITIETVTAPLINGNIDSAGLYWSEDASEENKFAMIVRNFYIRDNVTRETIGIKDFVPQPTSDGYEPFSQLIERANKWLKDQSDIRVTNMQSIILPKRDTTCLSDISSTCFTFVPSINDDKSMEYLRILRVAYTNPAEEALSELPLVYPFYFETFTPELVQSKDNKKRDRTEKMKETFSRIATFLKSTELDVICVEVVANPINLPDINDPSDGSAEKHQPMKFINTLRLYVTGQVTAESVARILMSAPPPSSARSINSPPGFGAFNSGVSIRDKNRPGARKDSHPGPIFLRNVTTGPRRNRMIVAFVTVFVGIMIVVVLSVVYSNKS